MESSGEDSANQGHDWWGRIADHMTTPFVITGAIALVGAIALSFRGGSISMSVGAAGLALDVNPPR